MDFHSPTLQYTQHPACCRRVMLIGGNQKSRRDLFAFTVPFLPAHPIEVEKKGVPVDRRRFNQPEREVQFVLHDIPQPPPPALPGIGKLHAFPRVSIRNLSGLHVYGGCDPHRRGLAQNPHRVM